MTSEFCLSDKRRDWDIEDWVYPEKDVKTSLQNLRDEIEEASKHIKVCDKLKQRGKEIILSEDLCSVKDVETFLNKIDKAFEKHIGELE